MKKAVVILAEGFEEGESLETVDILRRCGVGCDSVSIGERIVTGCNSIKAVADYVMDEVNFNDYDMVILPGGMPGASNLAEDGRVIETVQAFMKEGKYVAAICAAPSVLGQAGILNGKKAACHPGFEEKLTGAEVFFSPVVCDGNVITSRGMGTAVPFGLAVARYFTDDATIEHVKAGLVYA